MGFLGSSDESMCFDLSPSIAVIKKRLREKHKAGEHVDYSVLIQREELDKRRVTLTRWLRAIVNGSITVMDDLESVTPHGYDPSEVVSAIQKDVRRGNALEASWWALEIQKMANYRGPTYAWKRLRVISIEDIGSIEAVRVVEDLYRKAGEASFLSEDGLRFIVEASWKLAMMPRKTRFFDEINEYFVFVEDGKVFSQQLDTEATNALGDEELVSVFEKHLSAGEGFLATWYSRFLVRRDSPIQLRCWGKILDLAQEQGEEMHKNAKYCFEQAKGLSTKSGGFATCDSLRGMYLAIFLICRNIKGNPVDSQPIPEYDEEKVLSALDGFEKSKPEIPDYALDGHTKRGKMKGRSWTNGTGMVHWYLESSRVNNKFNYVAEDKAKMILRAVQRGWGVELNEEDFEESFRTI